uniref:Uncharacterized protein n=1 Tax=Rhizophora mucronata TaxID=61149 RepID=A0A2P2QZM4_RHIMU
MLFTEIMINALLILPWWFLIVSPGLLYRLSIMNFELCFFFSLV